MRHLAWTATALAGLSLWTIPSLSWAKEITVSSQVPVEQQKLIAKDLSDLKSFSFSDPDPEMTRLMGIQDASSASMLSWLQDRVHYIIGEDFPFDRSRLSISSRTPEEPTDPKVLSLLERYMSPTSDSKRAQVVMSNVGIELYNFGKMADSLVSIDIDGVGKVPVTSPRIGLIQVGEGMFSSRSKMLKGLTPDSRGFQAFRLMVLFHEARHSDGNGKSLGFLHSACPKGHSFEGLKACDRSLNGSYAIGASFLKSMIRSCKDCTKTDIEAMKLLAADSESRIIKETPREPFDPKIKLKLLQDQIQACEEEIRLGAPADSEWCKDMDAWKKDVAALSSGTYPTPVIQSKDLDATPEGQFDF